MLPVTTPPPTVCPQKTTSGKCCSIPFKYRGVTYNSCISVNHNRPWCSLDPVYMGRWGNCGEFKIRWSVFKDYIIEYQDVLFSVLVSTVTASCPQKTTSGQCCSIPFIYKGVIYKSCTSVNHNRPWCSLDPVYKGKWGNCGEF